MVASFPTRNKAKKKKKEEMLQKGGSNIWIVPVPHDQISTYCQKNRLAILLASIHAFLYTKIKK